MNEYRAETSSLTISDDVRVIAVRDYQQVFSTLAKGLLAGIQHKNRCMGEEIAKRGKSDFHCKNGKLILTT